MRLSRATIYLLVFFSGMASMGIEMLASKLLAPYFGESILVWANIIGLVMAALALGYWLGGKLSDRAKTIRPMGLIVTGAGILTVLIPVIVKPLGELVSGALFDRGIEASGFVIGGSLVVIFILLVGPVLCLGMVGPVAIGALVEKSQTKAGGQAGKVFALSTLGSILGTFTSVLIGVPLWGTRMTLLIFGGGLILIGLLIMGARFWAAGVGVMLVALVGGVDLGPARAEEGLIYEGESVYQYIQIYDTPTERILSFNDGNGLSSARNKSKILTERYFDLYNLLPLLHPKSQNILLLGLAGGVISAQLEYFFPEMNLTGVEIDRKVIAAAEEYFDLDKQNIEVVQSDGRVFISLDQNNYDLIIVDAYSQQLYIPGHMISKEFFELAASRLSADGVLGMNINAPNRHSALLRSIAATVAEVFDDVYLVPVDEGHSWNYMLVASQGEIDFSRLRSANRHPELIPVVAKGEKAFKFSSDKERVFTDDWAPVYVMMDGEVLRYVWGLQ